MNREDFGQFKDFGLFLNNEWRLASDGQVKEVTNPATEEVIGFIPSATACDLDEALADARLGFALWRVVPAWNRSAILRSTADILRQRVSRLAELMSIETGKPIAQAQSEWCDAADQFEWYAEEAKRIYGQTIEARSPDIRMHVRLEPVGPVAAFTAWNFPALLPARKLAAALAAGCSVILKPAGEAPGCGMAVVAALKEAGLPARVVSLVTGDSAVISEALVRSPIVRKVSLTGSTRVGRQLLHWAAEGVKKVTMELGGHAPVLVFSDADIDETAAMCARFKYRNCGQVCASPTRFYVHEASYARFCAKFTSNAQSMKLGSGLDPATTLGPLISRKARDHALMLIQDAQQHGARLLTGGAAPKYPSTGFFLEPTVLADVPPQALIMHDEPFAPVAPIASFATFDQAIELANSTSYGLSSYVFTRSLKTAAMASEAIEAGMVGVNELAIAGAEMPFGGVKESGMGREGGAFGIRDYLEPKFVKTRLI